MCLQDVHPDGQILNVQEGGAKIYSDASSTPRVQKLDVSVWATRYELKVGHKLRVVVASAWFPRFNRNLNSGEPLATAKEMRRAKQTIYFGKPFPSCVTLPVLHPTS